MIARSLYNMVKKWEWTKRQEKTFKDLKERFIKEPVLIVPDLDKKNKDGSKCVRLCYRRDTIYKV